MAKSLKESYPWEPHSNDDADKCVSENESIQSSLTENMSEILKSVDLVDNFWTLLLQHNVVNVDMMRTIQAKKTKNIQALSLMQHIMELEVYKFHGFIWALVNSNQCHLAELLGFPVCDYLDVEVFFMSSTLLCPACQEFYTKAYILTGCGHYICAPCVKGAQFVSKDVKIEEVTCPVPKCCKITEAFPSDGHIGLNEDADFSDLCQAVKKWVTKESAGTTKDKSATKWKKENKHPKWLQGCIGDSETGTSRLQKYKDVLGKYEPALKDYITNTVEKVKQNVDEWAKETLGWYSSLCQQVEQNLQKSEKWQKAVSELSIVMGAWPGLLEGCLKDRINLPEKTVTDAGEKLITKLDAGCPIPPLFTKFPYMSIPPEKAKYLMDCNLTHGSEYYKLSWLPDSSLMALNGKGVWRFDLDIDTAKCTTKLIQKTKTAFDLSVAADGTWILVNNNVIEVHYPGQKQVKKWRPEGAHNPCCAFINNKNIYVSQWGSQTIRSYSRELVYVNQYDIGTTEDMGDMCVTGTGILVKSSCPENRLYTMDLGTKETSSFDIDCERYKREDKSKDLSADDEMEDDYSEEEESEDEEEPTIAWGVCTVNDGEYLIVCDKDNSRVNVFTPGGLFIHHLDLNENLGVIETIAVLARRGKPSLMAVYEKYNNQCFVRIYSLE